MRHALPEGDTTDPPIGPHLRIAEARHVIEVVTAFHEGWRR
jgi:hypothetical protein